MAPTAVGPSGLFRWRDLQIGQWSGPDLVMMWGRRHAFVFSEGAFYPIWVPEHTVHHHRGGSQAIVQTT